MKEEFSVVQCNQIVSKVHLLFSRVVLLAQHIFYGVATISRLLKIIGLFCKRALSKRLCSAKETYNFKEPTNRSHPIGAFLFHIILHSIWGGYD